MSFAFFCYCISLRSMNYLLTTLHLLWRSIEDFTNLALHLLLHSINFCAPLTFALFLLLGSTTSVLRIFLHSTNFCTPLTSALHKLIRSNFYTLHTFHDSSLFTTLPYCAPFDVALHFSSAQITAILHLRLRSTNICAQIFASYSTLFY